jgi:hypothetical protein
MVIKDENYLKVHFGLMKIAKTSDQSLILNTIAYWSLFNEKARKKDVFHDNYYWTYISATEFSNEYVPCNSVHKVRAAIKGLKSAGLLIARDFKHRSCTRKKFYRLDFCTLDDHDITKEQLQKHFNLLPKVKRGATKPPPSKYSRRV